MEETQEKTKEQEYLEQLQRLQADFINYRNRMEKELQSIKEASKDKLLKEFLEVKDNFERIPHKDQGIEMIYKQMETIFQKENVEEITETKYNPELHEAIATAAGEEDAIIQITRKGYTRNGKILRPTQIILGKHEKNKTDHSANE